MDAEEPAILAEQVAYYRARAAEYDEWFFRQGRYDRGEAHRRLWFDEVARVEAALADAGPAGDILELACGTGIWTRHLAPRARRLTAVDASPEVITINRSRVQDPRVEYVQADIFRWTPSATYDFIFFGFWLSHVPPAQFEVFWALLKEALRPSGTVFFVDNRATADAPTREPRGEAGGIVDRRLNDGRTFRIVKIFYEPTDLAARLAELGWTADVRMTATFFIYGAAARGRPHGVTRRRDARPGNALGSGRRPAEAT
jgi:demethylmenaquinone methyltransferase/2-methoxy-6-polyprenyl-1,4-benzoquinol methylase